MNTLVDQFAKMSSARSKALPLVGGVDAGPLFVVQKQRPLVRPKGKEGVIHRAQTKRATPPWADMQAIRAKYVEARYMTQKQGELYVVDHIVPKIHPLVCGLHVPANLRVIHWRDNAIKGNLHWPDMWNEQTELAL